MHGTLACRSLHWRQPPWDLLCGLRLLVLVTSVMRSRELERYVLGGELGGVEGAVKIRQRMCRKDTAEDVGHYTTWVEVWSREDLRQIDNQ